MWRNSLQVTPTDTTPIVPELPDAKNAFGGMPLRGWEREIDQNVSAPMMIMYRGYMGKDCLTYAAMNQLLALAACTGTSQQLFVYDHSKLVRQPAAPTCRPPFRRAPSLSRPRPRGTHAEYTYGARHDAVSRRVRLMVRRRARYILVPRCAPAPRRALLRPSVASRPIAGSCATGGYNQQFRPGIAPVNSSEPDTWCAFEGRQSFCVRKESVPHDSPWAEMPGG